MYLDAASPPADAGHSDELVDPARNTIARKVWEIVAAQRGFITAGQARTIGAESLMARMVDAGQLDSYDRIDAPTGIYCAPGIPGDYRDAYFVPWLLLEPDVLPEDKYQFGRPIRLVASGATALRYHGCGTVPADKAEFLTTDPDIAARADEIESTVVERGEIGPADWTVVEATPVVVPHVAIGQLAAASMDGDHLGRIIYDAMTETGAPLGVIAAQLDPHADAYGFRDGMDMATALVAITVNVDQWRKIINKADQIVK